MNARNAKGERARLFFAIWPGRGVQAALGAVAQQARVQCAGRAIVQDNIHLTLFFVGPYDRSGISALERAAACVGGRSFSLVFDRLGYWRHNRIVWAGVRETPAALSTLASRLSDALVQTGLHSEHRPYTPHVTLVRNAERKPPDACMEACVWDVKDFALMESVSVGGGVRYQPVALWRLDT